MKVIKREYHLYKSFKRIKKNKGISIPLDFGRFQYIYSNKFGKISLVKFKNYMFKGDNFYEIYCLEGNLFEDVERFKTKKQAEKQIKKYLTFRRFILGKVRKIKQSLSNMSFNRGKKDLNTLYN